jgi:predicted lipid-binding transport protein (Tim44 family)
MNALNNEKWSMNRYMLKMLFLMALVAFVNITVLELDAFARAGGGISSGSRGSRSYSSPSRSVPSQSPSQQQAAPSPMQPSPAQQPGGGFLRGLGGGILGGLLGGMLFSSLGFGGTGYGLGGSGIGLLEILLIGAGGYFLYRMVSRKGRSEERAYQPYGQGAYPKEGLSDYSSTIQPSMAGVQDIDIGTSNIRQMDPSFDESRFKETAMDIFFRIQAAWMNRDLSSVTPMLTDEMRTTFQADIETLKRERKINRIENIAVRTVEITEAWQESGQDFITARFYANLLDYTVDDSTGEVITGSKTEPVKFEEYWTFTRPVGNNTWKLSAITQG